MYKDEILSWQKTWHTASLFSSDEYYRKTFADMQVLIWQLNIALNSPSSWNLNKIISNKEIWRSHEFPRTEGMKTLFGLWRAEGVMWLTQLERKIINPEVRKVLKNSIYNEIFQIVKLISVGLGCRKQISKMEHLLKT